MTIKTIELEKTSSVGKLLVWKATIQGNVITYRYGQKEGKIQEVVTTIQNGKNVGRSNETTPAEQAILEAETKALKKVDSGYQLISGIIGEHKTRVQISTTCPKPMLAHQWADHGQKVADTDLIYCQPKLDGVRVMVDTRNGQLYSRTRKPLTMLPHLEKQVKQLGTTEWVDGELYSPDLTFEEIISITRNRKITHESHELIKIHLFDVVLDRPFEERLNVLKSLNATSNINMVETCRIAKCDIKEYHDKYVKCGNEGIMLRVTDRGYEGKRSYQLYKYKEFHDGEFKIVGFKSQKNDANKLGAIELINGDGETFYATPKVSLERRQEIWDDRDSYLNKVATVKYQGLTEKGVPRFGNVLEIRDYE